MKAHELLKELPPNRQAEARAFITAPPPHPDELDRKTTELILPAAKSSRFDQILLEQDRTPDGTQVKQETAAVGLIRMDHDPDHITLLGAWDPATFQRELARAKPAPKQEHAMT